jgi:uncharacterized protein
MFHIKEIWRYPVKSMQGEKLAGCMLTKGGIPLDRGWAMRDEKTQTIRGAKHIGGLLQCKARYVDGTSAGLVPHVEITLPDGSRVRSDDHRVNEALTSVLGRPVTLWPLQPADNSDHYRLNGFETGNLESDLRMAHALGPDFSAFPRKLLREISSYVAPRGTYFDAFPVNVLTEASIRYVQALTPQAHLDVRRFRPNFLVSGGETESLIEDGWVGRHLAVGQAKIDVVARAPRCIMVSREQGDIPRDANIMRTLIRETGQCLSVYADVIEPGYVLVGAPLLPVEVQSVV